MTHKLKYVIGKKKAHFDKKLRFTFKVEIHVSQMIIRHLVIKLIYNTMSVVLYVNMYITQHV